MPEITVKIVNKSGNPLPSYATTGSSGMDLRAFLQEPVTILPLERMLVPTGLQIELPEGFEAQVRPRSGIALKQGITCLNTPGTIDSDYRGEIKILLINLSDQPQEIKPGERIAQMVIQKVEKISWSESPVVEASSRNEGGFGHTGKH